MSIFQQLSTLAGDAMHSDVSTILQRVRAQRNQIPNMYGRVNFDQTPLRFSASATELSDLHGRSAERRAELLSNRELVERIRAYTLLGDSAADAYAALIPHHGLGNLIGWLSEACDRGIDSLDSPPPELVRLLGEMEVRPDWIDLDLVEEGARQMRNRMAHLAPIAIRGAFLATFLNKYSALPMAMTGALSTQTAGQRVLQTANFFTVTALPGALRRYGPGFKAAALVRLMHSVVRFHALSHPERWATDVYGIPIPQLDQMPAGLIVPYLAALRTVRKGRDSFSESDRAMVEHSRYRCFLLGLPQDLLPDMPKTLLDLYETRHATLRAGFDTATCGALIRATMAADLGRDPGLFGALRALVEPSFARHYFVHSFLDGNRARAVELGITLRPIDALGAALGLGLTLVPMAGYGIAQRMPGLGDVADRALIRKMSALIERYEAASGSTDATQHRHSTSQNSWVRDSF